MRTNFCQRSSSPQAVENAHPLLETSSLPWIGVGVGGDGDFDKYCFKLFGCVQPRYRIKVCDWSLAASCSCVGGASESATLGSCEKSTRSSRQRHVPNHVYQRSGPVIGQSLCEGAPPPPGLLMLLGQPSWTQGAAYYNFHSLNGPPPCLFLGPKLV